MTDYQSSCEVLIDILNEYGYNDPDYYFEDKVYEKRINELNWRFGFEFDDKNRYYSRYNKLKNKNKKLQDKNKKLQDEKQVLIDGKEKLKKENERLKTKYDELINSNNWKLTEPLRKLKNGNSR